ncbi:MAG TPA: hypothetical protein VHC22_31760 [Pirellulales bacterium]|nr:hypothetical protein [Pirellulales bacterium]
MASPSSAAPAERIDHEDDSGDYRGVSALAVAAVILGVGSILAFVHPLLQLVPLSGVVIAALALRNIAALSPRLIGRKAALVGMTICLVCLLSAPIYRAIARRGLRAESTKIAEEWFGYLRENRPELAFRLTQYPSTKEARSKPGLEFPSNEMMQESLRKFATQMPMNLLLKLGKRAHVRSYCNEEVWTDHDMDGVRETYVVTVGEPPMATSFFICLGTTRSKDLATGDWQWQITKHDFVTMPSEAMIDSIGE